MKRPRLDEAHSNTLHPPSNSQPRISRKVRACEHCQNRKIKCESLPGQDQCARCARLGLACVINKSLQTLLDDENEWKKGIETQVQELQKAIAQVQHVLNLPRLDNPNFSTSGGATTGGHSEPLRLPPPRPEARSEANPNSSSVRPGDVTAMTRQNSADGAPQGRHEEVILNTPMASLYEVTKLRNIRSNPGVLSTGGTQQSDFISQGKLGLQDAKALFSTFRETLNAYLWGGLALVHTTLEAARASSTILTAAVLTVTALHIHDGAAAFDICYPIFLELTSHSVFARYHTLDDVRGLCIGAFWLSDVSWKLSGLAVRIAIELNLHQFTTESLKNATPQEFEKARLWYLLYVCDHHFSIAYGRPPMINESGIITSHESALLAPMATTSDLRLHSQVSVFSILSRISQTFGSERSKMINDSEFGSLRQYDLELGLWRDHWEQLLVPDQHVSQYPSRGVVLHYHFARLQLFSVCLRGLKPSEEYTMSTERRDFINNAIQSGFSALNLILDDPDMRKAVLGMPLYLLTTITYACLFLIKLQSQWTPAQLNINTMDVVNVVERTTTLLHNTHHCERHVIHYVKTGLSSMLKTLKEYSVPDGEDQSFQDAGMQWLEDMAWDGEDWKAWFNGDALDPPSSILDLLNYQMTL
ncbi:Zn(2)-C6 fungal-type domain-containing protein [Fusarium sp. Ph1]|nr:Zn(2)-C6 fungal-type domain-containing protein [Fusarium sp. Ph1]